jgi:hypothetical protein
LIINRARQCTVRRFTPFPPDLAVSGTAVKLKLSPGLFIALHNAARGRHKLATRLQAVNGSCE